MPESGPEILPQPRQVRGPELPIQLAAAIQPDLSRLPVVDPLMLPPSARPNPVRELTESACWQAAIAFLPPPDLFDPEFAQPWLDPEFCHDCSESAQALLRDARESIDATARNTAGGLALEEFYRLADVETRAELLRSAMTTLDELRKQTQEAHSRGVIVPVDPEVLDRQRANLLRLLNQAELVAELLNISLKRRIGLPGTMPERLWPHQVPNIDDEPINVAAEIQTALSQRPDLRLLRLLYLRLDPETLPAVRELLRGRMDRPESKIRSLPTFIPGTATERRRNRSSEYDALARAEVAVLRQRIADLIAMRERQTADEVRSATAMIAAQLRQVALARWKAEQLQAKAAASDATGPLAQLAAQLEATQAQADLIEAVMAWHQAKLRLRVTRGEFAQQSP